MEEAKLSVLGLWLALRLGLAFELTLVWLTLVADFGSDCVKGCDDLIPHSIGSGARVGTLELRLSWLSLQF